MQLYCPNCRRETVDEYCPVCRIYMPQPETIAEKVAELKEQQLKHLRESSGGTPRQGPARIIRSSGVRRRNFIDKG